MIVLVVVGSESMELPSRPAREAAFWMMDWTVTVFISRSHEGFGKGLPCGEQPVA
jgi:hypothetical protein